MAHTAVLPTSEQGQFPWLHGPPVFPTQATPTPFSVLLLPPPMPCTALIQHNVSGCWGQGQGVAFQEAPS